MRTTLKTLVTPLATVAAAIVIAGGAQAGNYEKTKAQSDDARQDIVTTAVDAGQFSTLAAALQAAGLVGTLQSEGPFTVFAPTDAAFAKLPEGTVASLLEPANRDKLIAILTYHVVPGKVASSDVVNLSSAPTVNGDSLTVDVVAGAVRVDNATVVMADIEASNGVIHVIDTVMLPQS